MNKKTLILGGTSDVALELYQILSLQNLEVIRTFRGEKPQGEGWIELDVTNPTEFMNSINANDFENVFCFIGYCPIPQETYTDENEIQKITGINYHNLLPILEKFVHVFEKRGSGNIVGVSSVAGDRGRSSNYLYGSAKAGFTAYLSGIRNRLAKHGVHVMTVLPGFMDTKMTKGLDTPKPLTSSPSDAAQQIFKAFKKRKNVIYVGGIWRLIMMIIRNIPEFIFKKLSL